eukprot:4003934-Pleurochrysis_carterae.AAC.6
MTRRWHFDTELCFTNSRCSAKSTRLSSFFPKSVPFPPPKLLPLYTCLLSRHAWSRARRCGAAAQATRSLPPRTPLRSPSPPSAPTCPPSSWTRGCSADRSAGTSASPCASAARERNRTAPQRQQARME